MKLTVISTDDQHLDYTDDIWLASRQAMDLDQIALGLKKEAGIIG